MKIQATAATLHSHWEPNSAVFVYDEYVTPIEAQPFATFIKYNQSSYFSARCGVKLQIYATWTINVHDYAVFFSKLQDTK